ncbi:MAG: diaminopropionate ammonia-lyase [Firmicutes bacterium]|nr:diaminopropionate ammonia-lyase [Bacillota bacterium]
MSIHKVKFCEGVPHRPAVEIPAYCRPEAAAAARRYHQDLPGYEPTPLHCLPGLAQVAKVGRVVVKDEALRFNLNAFKVLGASYAIARLLAQQLQLDGDQLNWEQLASLTKERLGQITLVTATDGNHGRAVAWAAEQLGQRAVVYLPQGAAPSRIEAIAGHGAEVIVTDSNYDDAVRLAAAQAAANGWFLVQDTAVPGYEDIPAWIMQGYTTIAAESWEQMQVLGLRPTHIFLQAGVGSLAASQVGYWQGQLAEHPPKFVVMEPEQAACFYLSAKQKDGQPHAVGGNLETIMAGLSCGEPNPLAWPLLRDYTTAFASCPDYVAAYGMRIFGNPWAGGERITAGESGAVGAGLLALLAQPTYQAWRQRLGLTQDSVVLLINSEGATDPVNYQAIVWDGKYPLTE